MKKFDIFLVDLNPVKGSEQSGVRPCIVIQNNFANASARTFVVAILSSVIKNYPHTLVINPSIENGLSDQSRIDLLQVRTIDQDRIIKNIGSLDAFYRSVLDKKIRIAFGI